MPLLTRLLLLLFIMTGLSAPVLSGFARRQKLTEREGRLLELGTLLLLAPKKVGQGGIVFGLMTIAVGLTWGAARLTR